MNALSRLVIAPPSPRGQGTPVFVTPESITTFPVASLAVILIWRVLGAMVPAWGAQKLVGVLIAFAVGMAIYGLSIDWVNDSLQHKIKAFVVAVINSFFLAASALGILDGLMGQVVPG